jgi:hypothetical protein
MSDSLPLVIFIRRVGEVVVLAAARELPTTAPSRMTMARRTTSSAFMI